MGMRVFCGTNRPRMRAVHDAMKDTDIAWACNSERLPMIIEQRTDGSSSSPMGRAARIGSSQGFLLERRV